MTTLTPMERAVVNRLVTSTTKVHAPGGPNGRTLCNRNPWRPQSGDVTCLDCQSRLSKLETEVKQ